MNRFTLACLTGLFYTLWEIRETAGSVFTNNKRSAHQEIPPPPLPSLIALRNTCVSLTIKPFLSIEEFEVQRCALRAQDRIIAETRLIALSMYHIY